jgi:hypothetical protein
MSAVSTDRFGSFLNDDFAPRVAASLKREIGMKEREFCDHFTKGDQSRCLFGITILE